MIQELWDRASSKFLAIGSKFIGIHSINMYKESTAYKTETLKFSTER
jgi:hypothetical protein